MENRIATLGIIVEEPASVPALNALLHEYASCILGRMGIPCRDRKISVITLILDAPQQEISALSGKIGNLNGVTCKAAYSKL